MYKMKDTLDGTNGRLDVADEILENFKTQQ